MTNNDTRFCAHFHGIACLGTVVLPQTSPHEVSLDLQPFAKALDAAIECDLDTARQYAIFLQHAVPLEQIRGYQDEHWRDGEDVPEVPLDVLKEWYRNCFGIQPLHGFVLDCFGIRNGERYIKLRLDSDPQ